MARVLNVGRIDNVAVSRDRIEIREVVRAMEITSAKAPFIKELSAQLTEDFRADFSVTSAFS